MKRFFCIFCISLLLSSCGLNNTSKRDELYPNKPINWVIPYGPGGGSDQFARQLINSIKEVNKDINIIPLNMPGAMTMTAAEYVNKQPADGYTILGATQDVTLSMVLGKSKLEMDDFIPVMRNQHNIDMWFVRSEDNRFSDFNSLIRKAEKGVELKIATTGLKGLDEFTIREIEKKYQIDFINIPFENPAQRYAALLNGTVDILHEQPGDIKGFLDSKDFRPVLAISEKKVTNFEEVPTTKEMGIPTTMGFWRGVMVKKNTPQKIVDQLENILTDGMETKSYKNYENDQFLNLREGKLKQDEFRSFIKEEIKYFKNSVKGD
jgi:putative tricarboxylic transport membrane protein